MENGLACGIRQSNKTENFIYTFDTNFTISNQNAWVNAIFIILNIKVMHKKILCSL